MKHSRIALLLALSGLPLVAMAAEDEKRAVGFPQFPSLSPDGRTVVFASAGDLWSVEATGGQARRITSHPADESRSFFSPDGSMLAFESEREGARAIYAMPVLGSGNGVGGFGDVRRLTVADRAHTLSGFTHDGKGVLLHSNHEPAITRGTRIYLADVEGKRPLERLTDAWGGSAHATPDGKSLVFTRGRYDPNRPKYAGSATTDLWRLDLEGGGFTRLTADGANEAEGYLLKDGSLVYVSSRDGQNNIWRVAKGADEGKARQLTFFKPGAGEATIGHGVRDFSVSPGGKVGVFAVWDRLYTIDLAAAKPEAKVLEVAVGGDFSQVDTQRINLSKQVSEAVLSPDGKTIALAARGEVFVRSTEKERPTRRVTSTHARERDLAWSPDGKTLYFVSDETGVYGLYAAEVEVSREDLRPKKEETEKKEARSAEETAAEAEADAKKAGEEAAKGEKTEDEKSENDKKDEKKPDHGKRWSEALSFKVRPVLVVKENIREPRPSPDGKALLVARGRGDLVLLTLETGETRDVLKGWEAPDARWLHDSRHVVFSRSDEYFNADVWVADTQGELRANLTRHPDNDTAPRPSADGKVVYFMSDRDADVNDQSGVYAVNLDRSLDGMSAYELADYFKEAAEAAKKRKPLGGEEKAKGKDSKEAAKSEDEADKESKDEDAKNGGKKQDADEKDDEKKEVKTPEPLKLDVEDAYLRVRQIVAMPGGSGDLAVTPGGERVIFSANLDGTVSLFSVDFKGKERKTVATGPASSVSVSLTGEKVAYVGGGEASIGKPAGGDAEKMSIDAPVVIEVERQQRQKFLEAARILGEQFYHPTLKGLDWEALTQRYLPLAMATRTDPEFNTVVNALFGELDGSHLGIRGGKDTAGEQTPLGYLGLEAKPVQDGWMVTRVMRHGPADSDNSRLAEKDVILEVNGLAAADEGGRMVDLPVLLAGTAGRETLLKVRGGDGVERLVLITPISSGADTDLRYDDEVLARSRMVERLSGGKLGYLHIRGMSLPSVRDFERDLYASGHGKAGLIIDVRDNGGGWTTDILLASLTAPRHAYTVPRGADPETMPRDAYPRDRRLIYHYNRPISVLINQNSYSNAEIFPHSIKTIGRGKIVGVPTFGAVISTGAAGLIDGSMVRTPFRGWHLPDGTDMENNGTEPDLRVEMEPADEAAGKDPQIEAAVKELLERSAREPFWDWKAK